MLELITKQHNMTLTWRVVIQDGKQYVEEYLTHEEMNMSDDPRTMKKALLDGLCNRWKRKYGTGIEVIDNGPGAEWEVRYKDDSDVEVRD